MKLTLNARIKKASQELYLEIFNFLKNQPTLKFYPYSLQNPSQGGHFYSQDNSEFPIQLMNEIHNPMLPYLSLIKDFDEGSASLLCCQLYSLMQEQVDSINSGNVSMLPEFLGAYLKFVKIWYVDLIIE